MKRSAGILMPIFSLPSPYGIGSLGASARAFAETFGVSLERMYGLELGFARALGLARYRDGVYTMTPKGAFYYHHYENYYTLAYIDKMWGILRREAFPKRLEL